MSEATEERKKKSIDIKGEPQCELQEPGLVRAALFDIMLGEPRRLGKISGLITTSVCVGWVGVCDVCIMI